MRVNDEPEVLEGQRVGGPLHHRRILIVDAPPIAAAGGDDFADRHTSDSTTRHAPVETGYKRRRLMEIINLGAADGLPPVDWSAIVDTLEAGSAPDPAAHNARTTWLATVNEDAS